MKLTNSTVLQIKGFPKRSEEVHFKMKEQQTGNQFHWKRSLQTRTIVGLSLSAKAGNELTYLLYNLSLYIEK